ncbi:MAG: hypothetical protein AAB289_07460 [Chloroflexota bacterium]
METIRRRLSVMAAIGSLLAATAMPVAADEADTQTPPAPPPGCTQAAGHRDEHAANGLEHCGQGRIQHWVAQATASGVVETAAVTEPVQVGGIWYVPLDAQRAASAEPHRLLGTVVSNAVFAPALIGGIWYVPPDDSQRVSSETTVFLGTVMTPAVTAPIQIGGILYVPPDGSYVAQSEEPVFRGTVETNAVTAPIQIGGILYVPAE